MKKKLAEITYQIKGVDFKNLEQVLLNHRFEKKNSLSPDYKQHSHSMEQRIAGSHAITERTAKPSLRSKDEEAADPRTQSALSKAKAVALKSNDTKGEHTDSPKVEEPTDPSITQIPSTNN